MLNSFFNKLVSYKGDKMEQYEKEVTVLDLYNALKKEVNKRPYYKIRVLGMMGKVIGTTATEKIQPQIYVDKDERIFYLISSMF